MQKQFSLMDNTHPYKNKLPINTGTRFDCSRYIVFISTHTTKALLLHELTQISKSSSFWLQQVHCVYKHPYNNGTVAAWTNPD